MNFLELAKSIEPEIIEWRRAIHQNAEIGFDLPKTTALVESKLREFGYEPVKVGKAGYVATVGKPGKTILLRADMDALPLTEDSGLEFAATNGNCHACGHDIHTASLLGAAKILKQCESELAGTVKIMFQPCEEGLDGMQDMLDSGLLDDPKPQAALALHTTQEKTGSVGLRPGYAGASCDIFSITINGLGTHGAVPEKGVDPIHVAAHMITAIQAINAREVAPDAMLVATVCTIRGGDAHNIIPNTCTMSGTIRTADNSVREFAKQRLVEICEGVAATFRATADVQFLGAGLPPMINDPELSARMTRFADETLGREATWQIPAMTGSEDFALLCGHMPSVLCWFGTGGADEGNPYSGHHPSVTYNEDALHMMAAVYAGCAAKWLADQ